ncbi:dehydrogenase/reductase SDR family member 11-like isoform X4 [Bacillus rossius redtenbacheri]|uniref:dehydrogenase/reductase SDR family member 11-like isoform X4 n=1 Tax=Bacillus rossius redtenbacheri TaxID=93214 RepID=UPI002FDD8EB7
MKVAGLARRVEDIEAIAQELRDAPGTLYCVKADVSIEEEVLTAFKWVNDNLGGADVLVNNAGVANVGKISGGKTSDWKQMFDVNVLALSICTREAFKSMRERGVDDGHIIHINSVAGQMFLDTAVATMYSSTKHAVTSLTEGFRRQLSALGSRIRITSISPGGVHTEMMTKNVPGDRLASMPLLLPEDIAEAVVYTLSTPPRVQVHELTIRPVGEIL